PIYHTRCGFGFSPRRAPLRGTVVPYIASSFQRQASLIGADNRLHHAQTSSGSSVWRGLGWRILTRPRNLGVVQVCRVCRALTLCKQKKEVDREDGCRVVRRV